MKSAKRSFVVCALIMLCMFVGHRTVFSQTVVWSENWEGDWTQDWHVDGGTWEVGTPTSGPDSAYSGQKCAATVLDGNYVEQVDSRLIRHTQFVVPNANLNPRLRFWHWFSFNNGDNGEVQIKVGDGEWETISTSYYWYSSNIWSYTSIDLSNYAGTIVQIAFDFHSQDNCYGSCIDVSSGWYVDDVMVITGVATIDIVNNPEDFETGIGNWAVERGTWEVGIPESGPRAGFSSQNCAGTRLNGNYYEAVDSRLVSPPFVVPNANLNPRLRFWHWFSFNNGDNGEVQIKAGDGEWETISVSYYWTGSNVWSYASIDLSNYTGMTVQIAFDFHSRDNCYGSCIDVSSGWYIDDVVVRTGQFIIRSHEDFESGIGDWAVEKGTWEVGQPSVGPDTANSPPNCAGTVLDGNYAEPVDSRFTSPPFVVPSADRNPAVSFWHWFSFNNGDNGDVQIKIGDGEWQSILDGPFVGLSAAWTPYYKSLQAFADSTVQLAFLFHSRDECYGSCSDISTGWYIDDIKIGGVNQLPVIYSFTATPTQGDPPLTVTFDCEAHDPDGEITSFRWDFDGNGVIDDTTDTGQNVHTYETIGTYEAKCTAVDNEGALSQSKSVMIYAYSDTGRVITVPDTTITGVSKGDTIRIPIHISEAARIAGAEIKLSFDQTIVRALYAEKSTLTNDFTIADSTSEGKIAISLARATALSSGSGDLFYVDFKVVTGTGDSSALAFEQITLYDEETNSIPVTPKDGKIIVKIKHEKGFLVVDPPSDTLDIATQQQFCAYQEQTDGSRTPATAAWILEKGFGDVGSISSVSGECTTLDATGPGDAVIKATYNDSVATALIVVGKTKGDINIDDLVSVPDCIRCLQYTVGNYDLSPYQLWAADMSEDGLVDVDDCQLILNKTLDRMLPKTIAQTSYGPATVQLGSIKQEVERVYTVPVLVNERRDVYASAFEITYDSNLLNIVAASAGKSGMIATNFKEKGLAKISMISSDGLVNSQGEILTLKFKAKDKVIETPDITIREVRLFDRAAQSIEVNISESATKVVALPRDFALHQNYPNPFNPTTMIKYDLPEASEASLTIFNTRGQEVRTLINSGFAAGEQSVVWDARDNAGQIVPAGVYFYKLSVNNGEWQKTKKMILLK